MVPGQETLHALMTESLQTLCGLLGGEHTVWTALREELVCIANQLLLQCFRHIVAGWKGQLLLFYLLGGNASASMPLADAGMAGQTLLSQQSAANQSVTQVRLVATAEDAGGVAPTDANVVEHSGLLDEGCIELQLRMATTNLQAAVGHLATVFQQQTAQVIVLRIIFLDKRLIHKL